MITLGDNTPSAGATCSENASGSLPRSDPAPTLDLAGFVVASSSCPMRMRAARARRGVDPLRHVDSEAETETGPLRNGIDRPPNGSGPPLKRK